MNGSDVFYLAIQNEIEVDKYFYKKNAISPRDYGHFPKVNYIKRYKGILARVIFNLVRVMWPFISVFFNLIQLVVSLLNKFKLNSRSLGDVSHIAFCSCNLSLNRISEAVKNKQLLYVFRPRDIKNKVGDSVNILQLVSYQDILRAFFDAVLVCSFPNKEKLGGWNVHTYVAFEWFLVLRAFKGYQGELYTADHFDRWAILIDRGLDRTPKNKYTLIQHGIVTDSIDEPKLNFNIVNKLENLGCVYLFDAQSKLVFENEIISSKANNVDIVISRPRLPLYTVDTNKKKVLFVGNSICLDFHLELLASLEQRLDMGNIVLFYKPHPTQSPSRGIGLSSWTLLSPSGGFPDVDIVISYPSTLAYEYGNLGKIVIQHALDLESADLEGVTLQVVKALEGI